MPKRGSGGGRDEALLCDADISELAQFGDAQINAKTRGKLAKYKRIEYSCNFRERGVARSYCKQDIKCSFEEKLHLFPHGQKTCWLLIFLLQKELTEVELTKKTQVLFFCLMTCAPFFTVDVQGWKRNGTSA